MDLPVLSPLALETWLAFVAAVLVLMSTPGPSQLLMLSNSAANRMPRAWATAAGDLTANLLQMLAAGLGLGALVVSSETAFSVVKWAGVVYLVWLGVQTFRGRRRGDIGKAQVIPLRTLWWQGFVTSAANPKAVIFFAALFPQFIDAGLAFWPQFFALSATYLTIDGIILTVYGSASHWLAARLVGTARVWIDRVAGAGLVAAAVLLGLRRATAR